MSQIFISYSSEDEKYAERLYYHLKATGYSVWFAPENIGAGADFAKEIGEALGVNGLSEDELLDRRMNVYGTSQVIVLLLSGNSMRSQWVKREVKLAIKQKKRLMVLRLDNERLTSDFEYMLIDVQIIDAYHLSDRAVRQMDTELAKWIRPEKKLAAERETLLTYRDIGVESISRGDPYFINGQTLKTSLSQLEFYLSPPADMITEDNRNWTTDHFSMQERLPALTWEEIFGGIPIPDLRERIENSRRKIFRQFLNQENGCYFNNKKYGVKNIRPYGRTEDYREMPILELEFYTTDYYTHRVMKDVCKQLAAEKNEYICSGIDYTNLGVNRIFFTSMGINLLLKDSGNRAEVSTILTERSLNAAETYNKRRYSLSVIEGVSLSDFDPYNCNVDLSAAVYRGLQEELGISDYMLQKDTLYFYELFIIHSNLEMGLSCAIDLDRGYTMSRDVMGCHGKDEQIEVSDKRIVRMDELKKFALDNRSCIIPQALFSILSVLEGMGHVLIDRRKKVILSEERFVRGKKGTQICGDGIFANEAFMAVIDGASPKGNRLWDGMQGDVFISQFLQRCMEDLPPDCSAEEAVAWLNAQVAGVYRENQLDMQTIPVEEQLQAAIIIYSSYRHEIWSFGDCRLRINLVNYYHEKKIDRVLSDLRAFYMEINRLSGEKARTLITGIDTEEEMCDIGRKAILPWLKAQMLLANTDYSFGYDTISGMDNIIPEHVRVYSVQTGDHIVMATDGYPELYDTLEESEQYLKTAIEKDPDCVSILRGTKGIRPGWESFDDRAYLSFVVK